MKQSGQSDTIIENAKDIEELLFSGVYYLIDNNEIVYIGQSTNVAARITTHVQNGTMAFDRYYVCPVAPGKLRECESIAIKELEPKYNKKELESVRHPRGILVKTQIPKEIFNNLKTEADIYGLPLSALITQVINGYVAIRGDEIGKK